MLAAVDRVLRIALDLDADTLTVGQMLLRTLIVYCFTVAIVRLGEKRFFGRNTAFDLVVSIILGSVISRAINGGAPFFPTLIVSAALVGVHWLLAVLAFHSDRFGTLVKGHGRALIRDGEIDWEAMRRSHLSEQDLHSALRRQGRLTDPAEVKVARLERSGEISVVPRGREPTVVECPVQDGVKVIRLEISD